FLVQTHEPTSFPITLSEGGAELLTYGHRGATWPYWCKGEPAPFDPLAIDILTRDIRAALAQQGFFKPVFTVKVSPQGKLANLVITLQDEGPRAVVGKLEVLGVQKNRPADVLAFLGLAEGMPIDAVVLQEAQKKLWNSARF